MGEAERGAAMREYRLLIRLFNKPGSGTDRSRWLLLSESSSKANESTVTSTSNGHVHLLAFSFLCCNDLGGAECK